MEDFLKKSLKITASCVLIASGLLIAGTAFAAKKIDSSDDKSKNETGSLKDKITSKIKKSTEKAVNNKLNKKSMAKFEKTAGKAKSALADVQDTIGNKIDDAKKDFNEK
ncbi:hypothetical protein FCS83_03115 [Oenococcus sp. UCMA 17063]|nr:hypothetical protein [Oenococcus sp. UCMA 17063]